MPPKPINHIRNTQVVLLTLSLLFSGVMIWHYRADKAACVRETLDMARAKVGASIGYAESRLAELERVGQELAREIAAAKPDADALEAMVVAAAEKHGFLNGICVAFRPFQAPGGKELYAPYYRKNRAGVFGMTYVDDVYNYADGSWEWFERPLEEGAVWHDPFYGKASGAFLVQYGVPVSIQNENDAVVGVNYSLGISGNTWLPRSWMGRGIRLSSRLQGVLCIIPMTTSLRTHRLCLILPVQPTTGTYWMPLKMR
ncbi:cache domain-containing protein [Desulfoluna butyratoxydans]|uniref:cache domain-containing protein n=1 Tax=Desulfoluna butyratoxydans TaxID=231438 RepID=UPI0015D1722D|nr:cache domain-containing protein [Desulfoluna butyratoxydans]